jgi:hypothetical protein
MILAQLHFALSISLRCDNAPQQRGPLVDRIHLSFDLCHWPQKKKPLHSKEGGKGFWVFDLFVVGFIAALTLITTEKFYFIHPLSSMILSRYTYQRIEREPDRIFLPKSMQQLILVNNQ